ncbi:MAG: response regulator [Magnetospirillum sp.]|nr:response regulator [Magnetospirillum sp.]
MGMSVDLSALKVLVVDDQEFVRTIVKKMLSQIGVGAVVDAFDGNSALAVVEKEQPDLVICDIQMRPMDGFGFVKMLRALPYGRSLPVILLTAHADAATVARAREFDVEAFLAKPVLPPALKDKIIRVMQSVSA